MEPSPKGLQGHGIDMIWDEATVRPRGIPKALAEHTTQHGLQTMAVSALVVPHTLNEALDAHLTPRNINDGIDQVQIGKLSVCTVIHDVHGLEMVI